MKQAVRLNTTLNALHAMLEEDSEIYLPHSVSHAIGAFQWVTMSKFFGPFSKKIDNELIENIVSELYKTGVQY